MKILGHKIVKIALFSIKITNCLHISFFFTNFAAHFVIEALTLRLRHEKPRFGRSVLKHGISSVSRRYLLEIFTTIFRPTIETPSGQYRILSDHIYIMNNIYPVDFEIT